MLDSVRREVFRGLVRKKLCSACSGELAVKFCSVRARAGSLPRPKCDESNVSQLSLDAMTGPRGRELDIYGTSVNSLHRTYSTASEVPKYTQHPYAYRYHNTRLRNHLA